VVFHLHQGGCSLSVAALKLMLRVARFGGGYLVSIECEVGIKGVSVLE
jgi:hypothetical protein